MAKTRVEWRGNDWYARFRKSRLVPLLRETAEMVETQLILNIGTPGPPHSTPGQYPRTITGELQESAGSEVDESRLTATVYADAPHAPYVEDMRPFLSRTLREMKPAIRAKLTGG